MAIHLAALSWALIFILRLRFPPGKSIAKVILTKYSVTIAWQTSGLIKIHDTEHVCEVKP